MKIAVVTDDGQTISQHFGWAMRYAVFTVEDGKIVSQELREKPNHRQFGEAGPGPVHGRGSGAHGFGPSAQDRHARMLQPISDCQVVLSGGMGSGAYQNLRALGIQPVLTDVTDIHQAVQAYLDGTLVDRKELLH